MQAKHTSGGRLAHEFIRGRARGREHESFGGGASTKPLRRGFKRARMRRRKEDLTMRQAAYFNARRIVDGTMWRAPQTPAENRLQANCLPHSFSTIPPG